jgi:hypothetical protein
MRRSAGIPTYKFISGVTEDSGSHRLALHKKTPNLGRAVRSAALLAALRV